MEIDSLTLDAEASRAAIEVRTTGKARARPDSAIDNVACWLVRFAKGNEADGGQWEISEVSSSNFCCLEAGRSNWYTPSAVVSYLSFFCVRFMCVL